MLLFILYLGAVGWLAIYGFNAFVLIFLYLKHRNERELRPPLSDWPIVTVQLPIYNEKYVVQGAIDSLVRLDWPQDRLQIQVLDDSIDETAAIARQCVEAWRQQGYDIELICRPDRQGFKAGALAAAVKSARGEYIAIFDADFRPQPDFIKCTVPYLAANPKLGFVQARWGHLNADFSLLTRAQALALDGHHMIEHTARHRAGWLANFSGAGGVWRRECIETCGWHGDTLTEDVDLGYRAQLAGWSGMMLPDVVAPAQLPIQLAAFKQQQFRWAKGNVQCLLKLAVPLMRAPLSLFARVQAIIHLSCYLAYPLMLFVMLCALPLIWFDRLAGWPLALFSLATLGLPLLYALGQHEIYPNWKQRLRALPVLIGLGMGLALSSTAAVIEALLGIKTAYLRTPKPAIDVQGNGAAPDYALPAGRLVWGEVMLVIYVLLTILAAAIRNNLYAIPFLLLYLLGFGYTSVLTLAQTRRRIVDSQEKTA